MKAALLGILVLVIIASGVFAFQEKHANLPPGVSPARWIPLTETSGIVLREPLRDRNRIGTHGTLMVKVHEGWREVYLDTPVETIPAKVSEP